ncbi:MAG: SDR family oxidoreductase [Spirochaetaceae bacterium]|nr:MAG: SDR family oxidoreductase [Spirochaetaceae bacterium]
MERFLTGRRALVIGGSGGIGAEVSVALARAGADLVIHGGTSDERLDRTAQRARDAADVGERAETRPSVETILLAFDPCRLDEQCSELLARAGRVDILVCSFGPYIESPIHDMTADGWRRMIDLNLTLPAILVGRILHGMRERRYGRIILFGGPRSDRIEGYRSIGAYAAAKAGLASLTRSVARQNAGFNVTCNMIAPGYVETEYYDEARARAIAAARPMGRMVKTDEIGYHIVHLLSRGSDSVNGAVFPVDFGE